MVIRKIVNSIALVLVLTALAITYFIYDIKQFINSELPIPEQGIILKVPSGSNLTRISNHLKQLKLIRHPRYLTWYARWSSQADKIHIGEYELKPGATPGKLLDMISNGEVIQYSVTLVEGWTFSQIVQALNQHEHINHEIKNDNTTQIMQKLNLAGTHPEGRFMPDTYYFPRGEKDLDILIRAYRSMQDYLNTHWPQRDVGIPIKDPYEALILASIVEKETGLATERSAIAGVFSRRLAKRMRLQSDPTVIYGMGERYKGNIRRSDLLQDTPYNTYTNFGLPPTPIAMPGRDAINAVLHPQEGDALYFVAKGDGSHYFSATLDEHNRAVIKYQLHGRKKPFSSYKSSAN